MLETTHDPIGDFVNAATSDVVDFTGRHDFESFKQNTDKLNELETYRQLTGRAAQCGYRINKVVYRGYGAPERLQQMHDQAIEAAHQAAARARHRAAGAGPRGLQAERARCSAPASRRDRADRSRSHHEIELAHEAPGGRAAREGGGADADREQRRRDAETRAGDRAGQADERTARSTSRRSRSWASI